MNRISKEVNIAVCAGVALLILLAAGRAEGASDNEPNLLKLAMKKFPTLTKDDKELEKLKKLFHAVVNGELADYSDKSGENNEPNRAEEWDENTRVIRAECIAWLCTERKASAMVMYKGIRIKGARIDGPLDLSYAKIPFPLYFEKCDFTEDINLQQATMQALVLSGTHTRSIKGKGLKVDGDVRLRDGFKAVGMVELKGATIGRYLDCTGGKFINETFRTPAGEYIAIEATGLKVKGNVNFCEDFEAVGVVSLYGAEIGRELDCKGGTFRNPDWVALNGDQMKVEGNVFLGVKENSKDSKDCFTAKGQVRLIGATIGGNLDCCNGKFANKQGKHPKAFDATRVKVGGDILLGDNDKQKRFQAEGIVKLYNAEINGRFSWWNVDSAEAVEELDLRFAKIGTLDIEPDPNAREESGNWLREQIGRVLVPFKKIDENKVLAKWPKKVLLHGLVYDEIDDESLTDNNIRLKWLRRQIEFRPQPYEQLGAVLLKSGQNADAKRILIAKNKDRAEWGAKLTFSEWCWYHLFGPMIGYGYLPSRALWWILGFLISGSIIFGISHEKFMRRAKDKTREDPGFFPKFNPWMYSVDVFVPMVDLRQEKYWMPDADSGLLRGYMWLHIVAGWVLSTLLAVGLTGLVRT